MNAEDLRIFVAVRQAASIKGAARALKVDHSTVSRRLAALEESLGVRLFDRTPEGLVATEAADAVSPLADQINLLLHEVQNAARAASDVPSGPVRIAVSPVVAEHFLMPRVAELKQRFPGIELDIRWPAFGPPLQPTAERCSP
jgi:DNA-binding transcriptional LysR family regulator